MRAGKQTDSHIAQRKEDASVEPGGALGSSVDARLLEADRAAAVKGRQAKLVARTVRLKALRVGTSYTRILDRNADYLPVSAAPSASVCMPICSQYE